MSMQWGRCDDVYALGEITDPGGHGVPWIVEPVAVVQPNEGKGTKGGPGWHARQIGDWHAKVLPTLEDAIDWVEQQIRDA